MQSLLLGFQKSDCLKTLEELRSSDYLRQYISCVFTGMNFEHFHFLFFDLFSDEVEFNIYVLSSTVILLVLRQMNGALVITVDFY